MTITLERLPGDRRRIRAFADAVDAPGAGAEGGIAALATALRDLSPAPAASPEFRTALRARLVATATVREPVFERPRRSSGPATPARSRRRRRRARLALTVVGSLTSVAAVGTAAQAAVPGDPLYSVKRGIESMELATTWSDYDKGLLELGFARTRLHEVAVLADRPNAAMGAPGSGPVLMASGRTASPAIVQALAEMDAETKAGVHYLSLDYRHDPRPQALLRLAMFGKQQRQSLTVLLPALAGPAQTRAAESLQLASTVATVTHATLSSTDCLTGACPATTPAASPSDTTLTASVPVPATDSPSADPTSLTPPPATSVPADPSAPPSVIVAPVTDTSTPSTTPTPSITSPTPSVSGSTDPALDPGHTAPPAITTTLPDVPTDDPTDPTSTDTPTDAPTDTSTVAPTDTPTDPPADTTSTATDTPTDSPAPTDTTTDPAAGDPALLAPVAPLTSVTPTDPAVPSATDSAAAVD